MTLGDKTVLVVGAPLSTRRSHYVTRQGAAAGRSSPPTPGSSPPALIPHASSPPPVSRLRNPALARVFREAGIMEQWGTGVQRVLEQVAEVGLRPRHQGGPGPGPGDHLRAQP
ncbi:ATP-binding protein [Actinomyces lilanjuaniae]|uniref:ATP-binding protein n=1 Tax=Actinomyces lilanjuaniae TaxID=2321394 RepID=UPI001FAA2E76|nr:ATP-binding protein [Actinomyces lilanjuaniae]